MDKVNRENNELLQYKFFKFYSIFKKTLKSS